MTNIRLSIDDEDIDYLLNERDFAVEKKLYVAQLLKKTNRILEVWEKRQRSRLPRKLDIWDNAMQKAYELLSYLKHESSDTTGTIGAALPGIEYVHEAIKKAKENRQLSESEAVDFRTLFEALRTPIHQRDILRAAVLHLALIRLNDGLFCDFMEIVHDKEANEIISIAFGVRSVNMEETKWINVRTKFDQIGIWPSLRKEITGYPPISPIVFLDICKQSNLKESFEIVTLS